MTLADLKKGQQAIIKSVPADSVPLKLLEMGCLPGNLVQLLQVAPFADPMYLNINGTHLAIRRATAAQIIIEAV